MGDFSMGICCEGLDVDGLALERLEEECGERGIGVCRINRSNKISISFLECINSVVIYNNASDIHIGAMTDIISRIIPTKGLNDTVAV